jgi:hypothetical protein
MRTHRPAPLVALFALSLGGCGGGSSSPPPPPPTISAFAAKPSWVITGQGTTLSWTVSGATKLSISGVGSVAGSSVQVNPAADTAYVLTASNDTGSTQAQISVDVYPPPTVWFQPMPTNLYPNYGSADYLDLFTVNAPWSKAAARIAVFEFPAQVVLGVVDDASVRNMFADLKRRHIALAMDWGPLTPVGTCGVAINGVEGFSGGEALHLAQRIHDLGGDLHYIAFDEPAGGAMLNPGCDLTPQQTAQNAAQTVAVVRSIFPDVVVGDIEGLPSPTADRALSAYQQWFDAWQAVTGTPFAFFHFDLDWSTDWKSMSVALARALRARHIPVGQIYIGDGTTDADWVALAKKRVNDFENSGNAAPDQIDFQSWEPYPKHLLPETDPTTFTSLIDSYFRDRTRLTLSAPAGTATGQLAGPAGLLAQAMIEIAATPLFGSGQVAAYQYSGTTPAGTQSIVFGARVGMEGCDLVGAQPSEFLLTDFTLDAGVAGRVSDDFAQGLSSWGTSGTAATPQLQGTNLDVRVGAGQTLGLGSAVLPFLAASAAYTFTVHATIPVGGAGGGCAIVVFLDASNTEITRAIVPLLPAPVSVGTAQTDVNGMYSLAFTPLPGISTLSAQYAGSGTLWPAMVSVVLGPESQPAITTASLPDGTVGSTYSQTLAASGGIGPYLWVAAPLPPGLTLSQDGALSGTPTVAGTYALALSVIDHAPIPQAADASLQLVVH